MFSDFYRYVYVGQLHIKTRQNYFPNHVPTAQLLFSQLKAKEKKSPTPTLKGEAEIRLADVVIDGDFALLLINYIDPTIPDHVVTDVKSGSYRKNLRGQNESPVISAHVAINIASKHDNFATYPMCIENNDFIARSYIVQHLNTIVAKHFKKPMKRTNPSGTQEIKDWVPRLTFGASGNTTIAGVLAAGGKLKGVKWIEQSLQDGTRGDGAYPVTERREVFYSVANRPTGSIGSAILQQITQLVPLSKAKKISITIEDENNKQKVVGIDSNSTDFLAAMFIPQKRVELPLSDPLEIHVKSIHKAYSKKLKSLIK
ncbi:hypothetical protein PANO111632_15765 [Paracoccus nototheniae]|uniref:Uncharacterized protein n=1 Tax=Paracoccus nototheniae TaxID=2489002 RepID=A0ABW4DPN7_9RHOB|nr:hypothetical protein [Paracoccus nototheniae]